MNQIIGIYSVAGHGKGEVDHVGGVAMTAICQDIAFKNLLFRCRGGCDVPDRNIGNKDFPK